MRGSLAVFLAVELLAGTLSAAESAGSPWWAFRWSPRPGADAFSDDLTT
ncbi:hypothetical protein [Streptomyces sp. NPDC002463]